MAVKFHKRTFDRDILCGVRRLCRNGIQVFAGSRAISIVWGGYAQPPYLEFMKKCLFF